MPVSQSAVWRLKKLVRYLAGLLFSRTALTVHPVDADNRGMNMKDRIKFSDEMLAAVIDGRKTQARRLIEPQPDVTEERLRELDAWQDGYTLSEQVCEAWQHGFIDDDFPYGQIGDVIPFTDKDGNIKGEIEIVDVWLQRVREISQEDAHAEGFVGDGLSWHPSAYAQFADMWMSIYGAESWSGNQWCWVIKFKQIQG